jgi:D-arabinan endo alpha-(1,5)-arabinofuranosidase
MNTPTYDEPFQMAAFMRDGKWIYMYGTANGRFGSVHVARVPAEKLLSLSAYEYWDGRTWQHDDKKAAPIAIGPAGEMSVGYDKYLGRYVMATLDEYRAAVVMREAPTPVGTWSGQRVLVQGGDGSPYAGRYAPFFNPASLASGSADLYFNMSLWGPYNVFLMKTTLDKAVDTANLLSDPGFEEQPTGMPAAPWALEGRGGVNRDLG